MSVERTWAAEVSRKIGSRGTVERITTRAGVTLHIPCKKGDHVVDVHVRPNLDPNGTVKQMLCAGWTLGRRKLACPDCSRKVARQRRGGEARAAALSPSERSAIGRKGAEARWGRKEEQMADRALEALQPEAERPVPTPAAGKGRRMAYLALEDYYDETNKRYKAPWTDAKIAAEVGLSEVEIKRIREQDFGPLGEPEELVAIRDELARARRIGTEKMAEIDKEYERIGRKLETLCTKMGWPVA